MAVPEKVKNRSETAIAGVKKSDLSMGEADDLIEIIREAEAGTNGLSLEDKVQANAVNIANLCFLFTKHIVESCKYRRTWKDIVVECRWPIVICVGIIATLLAFHPELAGILESFHNK